MAPPALDEVAAEMDGVFVRAGVARRAAGLHEPSAVSALRPGREGGRVVMIAVAAAAGLIGLGAGAFVVRTPAAAVQPPPAPQPQRPPAVVAQAEPVPIIPAPAPTTADRPQAASEAAPRTAARATSPHKPVVAAPHVRADVAEAQPASCERSTGGVGCRRAVIQADRHLRSVYENAFRRGVPHEVLIDYRDRWANLRERDTDDPARLIQNYGALAYDLGREAADDEQGVERRRGGSGWRALADAILPW
jgi:hypothetical protein